jgi:hypothetical protein
MLEGTVNLAEIFPSLYVAHISAEHTYLTVKQEKYQWQK